MPSPTPHALKAAYWRAARDGLEGQLIDLAESNTLQPAPVLLDGFVELLKPALLELGDYDTTQSEVARLLVQGNGAARQRRAWQRRRDVSDVVDEAAAATIEGV